jgi:hypothetical protein
MLAIVSRGVLASFLLSLNLNQESLQHFQLPKIVEHEYALAQKNQIFRKSNCNSQNFKQENTIKIKKSCESHRTAELFI